MKKIKLVMVITMAVSILGSFSISLAEDADLVIYTYDSFLAEWGPGPKIIPKFEQIYNVKVQMISVGDAGHVLNRAILEKKRPRADILLGIDNNLLSKALDAGVIEPYKSKNLNLIPEELVFDKTHHFTPFDYGYFAIVYDTKKITDPPESFEDLTQSQFRNKLILEDPRTSSPGLGFLLWTIAVYGEDYLDYWERLKPNILTITEGWDSAYGLFTSGEAPMVLSYTTSPAYHVEYEDTTRYRAAIFKKGNYLQIEGMGILKGAKNRALAQKFIDFIITEDFQNEIPLTNWMYPINPNVQTPDSFRYAPKPEKSLSLDPEKIKENQERWIKSWLQMITK